MTYSIDRVKYTFDVAHFKKTGVAIPSFNAYVDTDIRVIFQLKDEVTNYGQPGVIDIRRYFTTDDFKSTLVYRPTTRKTHEVSSDIVAMALNGKIANKMMDVISEPAESEGEEKTNEVEAEDIEILKDQ